MSVYEKLQNLYLDWLNNFLTRERFASWYDISEEQGNRIIEIGRKVHNRRVRIYKENHNGEQN